MSPSALVVNVFWAEPPAEIWLAKLSVKLLPVVGRSAELDVIRATTAVGPGSPLTSFTLMQYVPAPSRVLICAARCACVASDVVAVHAAPDGVPSASVKPAPVGSPVEIELTLVSVTPTKVSPVSVNV